ncbi:preprotein translocase subunit SecE [Frondihabitans sp. PhB188]|uniref:preprotein translocase subunit SecE n=1 Tax=Frondihabitans sp. PhB188 TaxID=2485200 RepID=UPI000F460C86|nr:preprotein translocase subunit SecE [Frondihabitans sp. PhB188]ROQ36784.1 preprotein translocase subunit SecE [Frondihabitans sp. PhB188]
MARKDVDVPDEDVVAIAKADGAARRGRFARIMLFLRQVINELKKVVTPTRKELVSFTLVVLVFVVIMMALVFGLDTLFGFAVQYVFGNGVSAG